LVNAATEITGLRTALWQVVGGVALSNYFKSGGRL
jgi:hypothetical protein